MLPNVMYKKIPDDFLIVIVFKKKMCIFTHHRLLLKTRTDIYSDHSIRPLSATMLDKSAQLDKMKAFISNQVTFENRVMKKVAEQREKTPYPNPATECKQPT